MSSDLPNFDTLWDYSRPAETEGRFRALLPTAEAAGDVSSLAQLLTQIARAEGLQRRFEAAHQTLDRAEALLETAPAVARVRYLLERGRVLNSSGKASDSVAYFEAALEAATAAGEENFAVDAAHMLGIVCPPEAALQWNERAMALAEAAADPKAKRWLGPLYNNTGWTYYDRGEYPAALQTLQKALAWYQQYGRPPQVRIARYSVGKALRALGQIERALAIQTELRSETEGLGEPDGYVEEEAGECLLALERPAEAGPHFARAYALLSEDAWLQANEPQRLERLRNLGGVTLPPSTSG